MADSAFTFSLVPDNGRIPFDTLTVAVQHIGAVVRGVDLAVSKNWRRPRRWYVERVFTEPPRNHRHLSFQVIPGERPVLVDATFPDTAEVLVDGFESLNNAALDAPPPYFSEDELDRLRKLRGSVFKRGVARIDTWVEPTEERLAPKEREIASVSADVGDRVDRILRAGYEEYGSVEGELGAIRSRNGVSITVWDFLHERPVRCFLARDDLDRAKDFLERRVRVSGLVRYYSDGRPARITEVQAIEDLSPKLFRPTARFGSIPDLTGGRDSVEYLRIMRE